MSVALWVKFRFISHYRAQVEWQDQKGSREKRGHRENEDRRDLLVIKVHR